MMKPFDPEAVTYGAWEVVNSKNTFSDCTRADISYCRDSDQQQWGNKQREKETTVQKLAN